MVKKSLWFHSQKSIVTLSSKPPLTVNCGSCGLPAFPQLALADKQKGEAIPFVVIDKETGQIIGSTRFCHAVPEHLRVEIGHTWYSKTFQRTAVNAECKLLLLTHAFETLDAIAVEFRTHWHNHPSRNAIAKLGAKQDGVLRNDSIEPDGAYRDTVVFSIINSEWPSVRKTLLLKLNRTAESQNQPKT